MEEETLREAVFLLGYTQHGGSGLAWQPSEVLELPLEEIWWHCERLGKSREHEANEIRKNTKKK